ncbi:MAG: hypothetical protein DCC75_01305, partial [Proteobacteria bacterium]
MPAKASGKFVLRLNPKLHNTIRSRAHARGISLNAMCQQLILAGLRQTQDELPQLQHEIISKATKLHGDGFLGLVLFGSVARGDYDHISDMDLLLVLERGVSLQRDLYRAWDKEFAQKISVHYAHLPAAPNQAGSLWLECARDGQILYDPSGRIQRVLLSINDLVASGKVVRKLTHGH